MVAKGVEECRASQRETERAEVINGAVATTRPARQLPCGDEDSRWRRGSSPTARWSTTMSLVRTTRVECTNQAKRVLVDTHQPRVGVRQRKHPRSTHPSGKLGAAFSVVTPTLPKPSAPTNTR